MAEEDRLKEYMDLVENLSSRLPSESTLLKLQKQCGLEPSDLTKLDMLVERHSDRAEIYLHRDNIIGAIEEIERACQLAPRKPLLRLNLAKMYKNRYENYGFLSRDRMRSKEEAELSLSLDNSLTEAVALIKEIDIIHKSLNGENRKRPPVIPIALLALLILVLFGLRHPLINWIKGVLNPPKEISYTPAPIPFDPEIPHDLELNSYGFTDSNLNMTLQSSRIIPVNDHWGYELKGGISSFSLALKKTELEMRFLDKENRLIYSESLELDPGYLLLPGENLPINYFFFLPVSPERIKSISLTPLNKELLPYEETKDEIMKIWWEGVKPEGVKLSLSMRENNSIEAYDGNIHYYTMDIEQRGSAQISFLEMTFHWRDNQEKTLLSKTLQLVEKEGPYMESGETRAINFQVESPFSLDWEQLSCDVTVKAVELLP
jgi:hypothetical protein